VTEIEEVEVACALEATHVTVLVPAGNACGDKMASLPMRHLIVGIGLPDATTEKGIDWEHPSAAALVTMFPGHVIDGGAAAIRQTWVARQVKAEPFTLPLAWRIFVPAVVPV
jgi:hypothetical protein